VTAAAEDDIEAERVTVWWQDRSELILAASHGVPLGVEHVDLTAMPADTVARYLQADPVRLDLSQMHDAQRAAGVELEEFHALAVPLTDGDGTFGVIFIQTRDRPLSDDVIASLQRFADEVMLAQRAARRHQLLTGVLTNSADGIVLVDRDSSLTFVSPAVAELSGRDIAVGAPLGALRSPAPGAKPPPRRAPRAGGPAPRPARGRGGRRRPPPPRPPPPPPPHRWIYRTDDALIRATGKQSSLCGLVWH
jgi:PAS domain-containing protein